MCAWDPTFGKQRQEDYNVKALNYGDHVSKTKGEGIWGDGSVGKMLTLETKSPEPT